MKRMQQLLRREYLLITLIVCIGFVFYLWTLSKHSLIYRIDGPYYLIQVRSLFETSSLAYGDPPLAFFLFALFTAAVGGNMTLGIKVGVALLASISAVPIYYLTKKNYKPAVYWLRCDIGMYFFSAARPNDERSFEKCGWCNFSSSLRLLFSRYVVRK